MNVVAVQLVTGALVGCGAGQPAEPVAADSRADAGSTARGSAADTAVQDRPPPALHEH